ncbi:MAG: xanthine dehydrogenase family protein molybdopterin-binding subunit [Chloroflexi bacterium]|nr:xanthine dehydrogenase family protein molybdopterin-binding subunit [Chloroflexota bacterium]MDA1297478.1 xanthine dehydrogenase family protein molybdopterin-binding subunit [Chloroflexota bacterium]
MVSTFEPKSNYKVIGTRPIRHDGLDKVTGRAIYGADIKLPGMLWAVVVRSPHAHARIKSIDTSAAEAMDGVYAVMTGADLPAQEDRVVDLGEGSANFRWASDNIMASDKALYRGHAVAAVAASDRYIAEMAAGLVKVEYEVLPNATNVVDALAPNAPIILEDLVGDDLGEEVKNTNMASHFRHEFGNVDGSFAKADHVIEREYTMQMVHQGYIEPHNATAIWDQENRVRIWTSTQGAFPVRTQTAGILKLSESRVKVTPLEIGGGFGGKIPIYLEPVCAILSRKSGGRPVKGVMERRSVFEGSGPAPGGVLTVKLGATRDGKLVAAATDIKLEAGAYPGAAVGAAAMCVFSCYDIANTRIDGWDIVVNKPKSSAYRAPGAPQATYAMESAVDELCEAAGFDKMKFRVDNAAHEGTRRGDGVIFQKVGMREVLAATKASPHWRSEIGAPSRPGNKRGRGIASGYWFNIGLKSSVNLALNSDGTVELVEGSTDIGGSRASIAMQAAEVLGITAEEVRPSVVDTESVGYTDVTGGSRTTYATGYAAWKAANSMVDELKRRAALLWEIGEDNIQFEDGVFSSKTDSELKISFKDLAGKLNDTGGPVNTTGAVDLEAAGGAYGTHICDLEIDPETGKTDVVRYTVVQDVGKAIHPSYVEGQMQGGAAQGVGWALNEEYFMNLDGTMMNSTYLDYRMPTSLDLPEIETVIVEVPNPLHPFGVRGVGEVPICPPIAAVANAIHDAVGVRLRDTPMNPGKIMSALEKKG